MSLSRNGLFARSIIFGAITKIAGSLIVFVGLPIIAHRISLGDYAAFLRAMTMTSAFGMVFGAAAVVFVRDLAKASSAKSRESVEEVQGRSLGLFIVLGAAALTLIVVLRIALGPGGMSTVTCVALTIVVTQLVTQWADAYRVATRTDHISSVWQIFGNCTMFVLLLLFAQRGLWAVILIYFGCPALAQLGNFSQLIFTRKVVKPKFRLSGLLTHIPPIAPMLGGGVVDYIRIFGAGALLSLIASDAQYSRYMTLVLLGARLVNPLSLFVRPLLPAYLDAVQESDVRWLSAAGRFVTFAASASLMIVPVFGLWLPSNALTWVLPSGANALADIEVVSLFLFIWAQGFSVLMTPLFLGGHRPGTALAINAASTALGLLIGLVGTWVGYEGSMLAGIGFTSCFASIVLIAYARTRFLCAAAVSGSKRSFEWTAIKSQPVSYEDR